MPARNADGAQGLAQCKGIAPDGGHAVWEFDLLELSASGKSGVPDGEEAFRKSDLGDVLAALESSVPDGGNSLRDPYGRQRRAGGKGVRPDRSDAMPAENGGDRQIRVPAAVKKDLSSPVPCDGIGERAADRGFFRGGGGQARNKHQQGQQDQNKLFHFWEPPLRLHFGALNIGSCRHPAAG